MIDLYSPDFRRNPFPIYAQIRENTPVLHDPRSGSWMILDYEGVKQVLADHERFSSSMTNAGRGNPDWFIFMDPPRQPRLRGLITRAFTPRALTELEPRIRELSRSLLDKVAGRRTMDLVADYATPLPMMVIAGMIGIPSEDWTQFRRWSDAMLKLSHTLSAGAQAEAAVAEYRTTKAEMHPYFAAIIQQRLAVPQDDLLTRLLAAEFEGERLTESEILGFIELLLIAGQETTSNLIANSILSFGEFPEQRARLLNSPQLLGAAIEEVLRYRSPVQWAFRATTCDVEVHGQTIPKGTLVLPIVGSANRDPRQFSKPDTFDIERNPNAHVAFGHGIHFCIGATLSRLEARIALPDLFERLGEFELDSSEPWTPRSALHVHGASRMQIRFEGGQPNDTGSATS